MADLDDIYSARILELAGAISHNGRLEAPDASATIAAISPSASNLGWNTKAVSMSWGEPRVAKVIGGWAIGVGSLLFAGLNLLGQFRYRQLKALREPARYGMARAEIKRHRQTAYSG